MKIFIYQNGRQNGPFSQEEVRLKLLSGCLTSAHLVWHSRLIEWVPLRLLASAPQADSTLAEPPDPEASSHFQTLRAEEPKRMRRRVRRSRFETEPEETRTPTVEKSSLRKEKAKRRFIPIDPAPTPAEASEPPRKRRSVKKPKQEAEPKKVLEINLWSMVKWFFAN